MVAAAASSTRPSARPSDTSSQKRISGAQPALDVSYNPVLAHDKQAYYYLTQTQWDELVAKIDQKETAKQKKNARQFLNRWFHVGRIIGDVEVIEGEGCQAIAEVSCTACKEYGYDCLVYSAEVQSSGKYRSIPRSRSFTYTFMIKVTIFPHAARSVLSRIRVVAKLV